MENYLTRILNSDSALSRMSWDIFYSAKDERWSVALVSLFVLVEQTLRCAIEVDNKPNLYEIINRAYDLGLISDDEKNVLHKMRYHRKMYFHTSLLGIVYMPDGLDGKGSFMSEMDTAKMIYETFSEPIFKIIVRLLNSDTSSPVYQTTLL